MRIYSTFQFYFHFEQCIIYLAERTKIIDVMLNQNKIKHTKKKKDTYNKFPSYCQFNVDD